MMNQDTASWLQFMTKLVGNLIARIWSRTNTKFRPEIHADGFTEKVDNATNNGYFS